MQQERQNVSTKRWEEQETNQKIKDDNRQTTDNRSAIHLPYLLTNERDHNFILPTFSC
jgi:hypothetical protein